MKSVHKVLISLLVSIVLAGGFLAAGVLGLFDSIEFVFFESRIRDRVETSVARVADELRLSLDGLVSDAKQLVGLPGFRNAFLLNQTQDFINQRRDAVQRLFTANPSFGALRIFDFAEQRLYYSSRLADISQTGSLRVVYLPVDRLVDYAALRALVPENGVITSEIFIPIVGSNAFNLLVPVFDDVNVFRGVAVFQGSMRELETGMISSGLLSLGRSAFFQSETTYLFDVDDRVRAGLNDVALPVPDGASFAGRFESADRKYSYVARKAGSWNVGSFIPEDELVLSAGLKVFLVLLVWSSTFLLLFLLLNLRQDSVVLITDRLRRFQIGLLSEYLDNKQEIDVQKWKTELRLRKEQVFEQILKGIPKRGKPDSAVLDRLLESSWDEVLEVLGSKRMLAGRGTLDIERIEQMMQRVLQNLPSQAQAPAGKALPVSGGTTVSAKKASGGTAAVAPQGEPIAVEELDELEDADEVADIEDAEDLDELEDVDDAEVVDKNAEVADEEVEDAEEVAELEDADETEELEAEDLDEIEEVSKLEEADEVEEAVEDTGPIDELDEVADLEPTDLEPTAKLTEELTEEPAEPDEAEQISAAVEAQIAEEKAHIEAKIAAKTAAELTEESKSYVVEQPVEHEEVLERDAFEDDAEELEAVDEEAPDFGLSPALPRAERGTVAPQVVTADPDEDALELVPVDQEDGGKAFLYPVNPRGSLFFGGRVQVNELGAAGDDAQQSDPAARVEALPYGEALAAELEQSPIIETPEGLAKISEELYAGHQEAAVEPEGGAGIEALLGHVAVDFADVAKSGGPVPGTPKYRKIERSQIRFLPGGFDFDGYVAAFGDDAPGRIKALVTLSRTLRCRFAALFSQGEGGLRFQAGLGYDTEVAPISSEDPLVREHLSDNNIVLVHGIQGYELLVPPHERSLGILENLLFFPAVYRGNGAFVLFGPAGKLEHCAEFVDRFVQHSRAAN